MKKLVFFLALILGVFSVSAEWINFSENSNSELFEIESDGLDITEIQFSLDGYELRSVNISGNEFVTIAINADGELVEVGRPTLPSITKLVAIPAEGEVNLEVISQKTVSLSDIDLLPRQSIDNQVNSENSEFRIDQEFYNSNDRYPEELIRLGTPAIMRGVRLVSVSVNPFQYKPAEKELTVLKNVSFRITVNSEAGENQVTRELKRSRFFDKIRF